MKLTILGNPITKKNHQQIVKIGTRHSLIQSKQYRQYENDCLWQIPGSAKILISEPVNVKCIYYMQTRHRVDLVNLLEATNDILVKAGVLDDDNSKIVVSHDGSRVMWDKNNPRVEIEIKRIISEV